MRDLILIPTYNEKNNISFLVPEIFSALPSIHILVIDDQSPDGTAAQAVKLQKIYPNLHLLSRSIKNGLGEAYKAAYASVRGQSDIRAIITMDADGSHQVKYLKDLLARIEDYDLVIGSRYLPGGGVENWEWWRQFLSRAGNIYSRLLTGLPIHDLTAGFICVRREVIDRIDFSKIGSAGYAYQIEFKYQVSKLNLRITEVPIIFKNRREGESKLSNQIISEGLKTPLKIFWQRLWKK